MTFVRLLAKSGDGSNPSEFLPQHLRDVLAAAEAVLTATATDQLAAFGLQAESHDRLVRCVRLGAVLHDLGKANDHFQGMVHGTRDVRMNPQGLRHEWVSILIIGRLRDWLLSIPGLTTGDLAIAEWAVGGHHRELPPALDARPNGEGPTLTILTDHNDFAAALNVVEEAFWPTESHPAPSDWPLPLGGPDRPAVRCEEWVEDANRAWDGLPKPDRRLAAVVKVCLIAADVAGSALPREVADPARRAAWIPKALANTPDPGDLAELVERRLTAERQRRNDPAIQLKPFQRDVSSSGTTAKSVALVKAGCGSGKTMAAYHWAATNYPTRRLYFCYPTTGTATEGYKDYLHNPEADLNYRLFHGRADVDLAGLLTAPGDPDEDPPARIESLDAWGAPVVSCTVDTVLGLMQNNRRGVYAWPALAGAAFVFDEIHAYDDRLFAALLRFLKDLPGLPALLMTASLSAGKKTALESHLKKAGRTLCEVGGPTKLEGLPRYTWDRRRVTTDDAATAAGVELGRADGKVLWVSNTVGRAMTAADKLRDFKPDVYHSRFRYRDRVEQHKAVVGKFQNPGRAVACCTQVAEMSLDLSATLLVTDLAPVPALIQRLGRLNRRAESKSDPVRPFVVINIPVTEALPYSKDELQAARKWLDELPAGPMAQKDLADTWEAQDAAVWRPQDDDLDSAWLDRPETEVSHLRKPGPGITVVLEVDAEAVRAGREKLTAVALPMPKPPPGWQGWRRLKGVPVAPIGSVVYCPKRGAEWA